MGQEETKKQETQGSCHGKGGWLMGLCCAAPLFVLLVLPLFGIQNQYLSYLAFFACPLTMIAMMFWQKGEKCH